MFRACVLARLSLFATTAPPNFSSSTDLSFYFPRFQPSTHVKSSGIPELQQALEMLSSESIKVTQPPSTEDGTSSHWRNREAERDRERVVQRWNGVGNRGFSVVDTAKCLSLLDRGIEILEGAGGVRSAGIRPLLLPLYATKMEILHGTAHLPRPTFDCSNGSSSTSSSSSACYRSGALHVQKHVLYHTSRLLLNGDGWAIGDCGALCPVTIDTHCVLLAHFVKAFSTLHTRPFNKTAAGSVAKSSVASIKSSASSKKTSGGNSHNDSTSKSNPYASSAPKWSFPVGEEGTMTLDVALERLDQLFQRCEAAAQTSKEQEAMTQSAGIEAPVGSASFHASSDSWKLYLPKLLHLKAILTIAHSGHLLRAKQYVDQAAERVHLLRKRSHVLLDGLRDGERPAEPELGLFLLAQAEMMARVWDWNGGKTIMVSKPNSSEKIPAGELDEDVFDAFENAAGFYAAPFTTNTKADGIMDLSLIPEREFEVHAYAVCVLSLAVTLLGVPRATPPGVASGSKSNGPVLRSVHEDTKPVFLPQQLFSLSPALLAVQSPSSVIFADSSRLRPFTVEEARRSVGRMLERALQLVRALYPDDRDHPLAGQILTVMACLYADTRDYLYASGLFESARRAVHNRYGGPLAVESVFLEKLRYEFLAGVGSAEEAKTAGHEIVHHLKQIDALPVE